MYFDPDMMLCSGLLPLLLHISAARRSLARRTAYDGIDLHTKRTTDAANGSADAATYAEIAGGAASALERKWQFDEKMPEPRWKRKKEQCDAKVVYWIRHAEGMHQVAPNGARAVLDPALTPHGKVQALGLSADPALAGALSHVKGERVELVVVSPLRRTMDTALLGFGEALGQSVPWKLDSGALEVPGRIACNKGNATSGKLLLIMHKRWDLLDQYKSLPGWQARETVEFDDSKNNERFRDFSDRLASRAEKVIIIVSHSSLIRQYLGPATANVEVLRYRLCGRTWSRYRKATPPPPSTSQSHVKCSGDASCTCHTWGEAVSRRECEDTRWWRAQKGHSGKAPCGWDESKRICERGASASSANVRGTGPYNVPHDVTCPSCACNSKWDLVRHRACANEKSWRGRPVRGGIARCQWDSKLLACLRS